MTTPSAVSIDKSKTAFLLFDFMQGILTRLPIAEALVSSEQTALIAARAAQIQVVHVRVAFTDADYAAVPATNKSFSYQAKIKGATEGSDAVKIVDALAPIDGELVVVKKRTGPFSTTDLHEQLQAKGINTLIVTGIATSGAILSTVREAADKDYGLIVVKDLVADVDAEIHRVLVEKVFPKQADVIDLATFLTLVQ